MTVMWDERQLGRYLDIAIRDFNRVVGIIPAACVVRQQHAFCGFLWKLAQKREYTCIPRERYYDWMEVYNARYIEENEIWLLLYVHDFRVYALKYAVENERVRRVSEVKDGFRLPSFRVNTTLNKFTMNS